MLIYDDEFAIDNDEAVRELVWTEDQLGRIAIDLTGECDYWCPIPSCWQLSCVFSGRAQRAS